MNSREKIRFDEEDFLNTMRENNEDFDMVYESIVDNDSEKGIVTIECTLYQISTQRYWKGTYLRGMAGSQWTDEPVLTEVFQKTKTITYYE